MHYGRSNKKDLSIVCEWYARFLSVFEGLFLLDLFLLILGVDSIKSPVTSCGDKACKLVDLALCLPILNPVLESLQV